MFTWFYIFNASDFAALGLVSRTYTLNLDGKGLKDILVTQGNYLSMTYEGIFLPLELNGVNPFSIDGMAGYIDENDNIWLGFEIED